MQNREYHKQIACAKIDKKLYLSDTMVGLFAIMR
jgi:hypothetical protein